MTHPDAFARHCHLKHLTAMLKASHAARLMRKGFSPRQAAKICGYGCTSTMTKSIRHYVKSPAPTAIGNGAQT
jgi:hypothetical protein